MAVCLHDEMRNEGFCTLRRIHWVDRLRAVRGRARDTDRTANIVFPVWGEVEVMSYK